MEPPRLAEVSAERGEHAGTRKREGNMEGGGRERDGGGTVRGVLSHAITAL